MTSRERVLTALDHQEPDRVPIHADFTPEIARKLSTRLKLESSVAEAYSGKISELPLALGHDLLVAWHGIATSFYHDETAEEYTCEWGIRWRWVDFGLGRYTEMVSAPLLDEHALSSYSCPDPNFPGRFDAVRELKKQYGDSHAIVGGMPCTFFETAWHLRGMSNLLSDMLTNKDFVHALLDKIYKFEVVIARNLAEAGVDIIWLGDDFGTQTSLVISPELWREFFKPRYEQLVQEIRSIHPAMQVAYHSDGNIEPLLSEYIDAGITILNAVQPKSVDPAQLKRAYGKRLSFWGTLDIQETFPLGTPEDVRREVKLRMDTVGMDGGLILGPSHNFQPDVPIDNILAFYDAVEQYGRYRRA